MLVLSRRKSQSIHIGPNIVVSVAEIRRSSVKLTIDAPRHVSIHRAELLRKINEAAAVLRPPPAATEGEFLGAGPTGGQHSS